MVGSSGVLDLTNNWISSGWQDSHDSFGGTLNAQSNLDTETAPGFVDEASSYFQLAAGSSCIDAGTVRNPAVLPAHDVLNQYVVHRAGQARRQTPAAGDDSGCGCRAAAPTTGAFAWLGLGLLAPGAVGLRRRRR